MGRFLCCWKCVQDHNDGTVIEGESLREELEEEEESKWLSSFHVESEKGLNKRAIAVAAATAAAADAAVAAAHAAVAVVRLTSKRSDWRDRYWAAVKVQSAFRGYLARKALRALKALVKLQAMVKGYLVRKQTALTLRSMQTLIRIQTSIQSKRSPIFSYHHGKSQLGSLETPQVSSSKSSSPKTINTDTCSSLQLSSPLRIQIPPHISIPRCRNLREIRPTTAGNTPRLVSIECSSPRRANYMVSTRSFDAKARSQSTPKRRPELTELMKRRASFNGSRESLGGLVDGCLALRREEARDYNLMKRW